MPATTLRKEEGIGLTLAIAAHIGLAAFLLWRPAGKALVSPPERMTVTLSEDLAPTSTSPDPAAQAAPDQAPTIGEPAPAPAPEPVAEPEPEPAPPQPAPPQPAPRPVPRPKAKPEPAPRPAPRAVQRPTPPRAVQRPAARPAPRPAQPAAKPAAKAPARPAAQAAARPAQRPANRPAGASSFADAFKEGVPGAQSRSAAQTPPAASFGPEVRSALIGALSRQIKPHWQGKVPQGLDTDKLVTVLSWEMNEDGSLKGTPRMVRQTGITEENRPQAQRHAEQAIRAVQLAAPFDLPANQYSVWRRVTISFDKRLAQ